MLKKFLCYFIGYILMVIGLSFMIVYINLLTFGFTFIEYFKYICTRYECYLFLLGLVIIITLFRRNKND